MNICKSGLHDKDITGVRNNDRCLGCHRESDLVIKRKLRGGTKHSEGRCGFCNRKIACGPNGLYPHKNNNGVTCPGTGRIY